MVPLEIGLLTKCHKVSGVIRMIEWYSIDNGFLVVMEQPCPCIDLFDFLCVNGPMDESLAKYYFTQIVDTVIECAAVKVIHRDIKVCLSI